MTSSNHALFQVSLKALISNGEKILTLFSRDGYVDFPGGRVDSNELDHSFATVLERELSEELGVFSGLDIGDVAFVAKRQYNYKGVENHVLAVYFNIKMIGNEIKLSDEHHDYKWLLPVELVDLPKEIFVSLDEYNQIQAYFS